MSDNDIIVVSIPIGLAWFMLGVAIYLAIGLPISLIIWRRKTCSHRVIGMLMWPLLLISGEND
jgi:hypothetical protein